MNLPLNYSVGKSDLRRSCALGLMSVLCRAGGLFLIVAALVNWSVPVGDATRWAFRISVGGLLLAGCVCGVAAILSVRSNTKLGVVGLTLNAGAATPFAVLLYGAYHQRG